jgi:hypothetical protein
MENGRFNYLIISQVEIPDKKREAGLNYLTFSILVKSAI